MRHFQYQAGKYFCENVPLASVAERYGTPAYLYSQAALQDNFGRFQQAFRSIPTLICYSVKANSHLRILRLFHEAGAGFDIVSAGELSRTLRVGANTSRVVFSGVGKTAAEIDAGLEAGILMFNVESAGELELLEARARALAKVASLAVRVNPDVIAATHPYIATGQFIHKFGVPNEEAMELYRRAARSPHLKIRGVACHIGSQILAADPFLEALAEILEVARQLREEKIEVEYLDIGGGFGIPYADENPLDLDELTRGVEARLHGTPYQLVIEPGRALVGDAGVLLARVLYVKRNQTKSFIVVDAGMNDLMRPTLYGSYHQIIPVERRPAKTIRADVVGPLCETGDFLAQDREMADVEPGDLLAVLTVGAYGYVLASNYNTRPRPAEVLVHDSEAELIRPRERLEELMAGEVL
jgi:diaminopimelate decarboxylase